MRRGGTDEQAHLEGVDALHLGEVVGQRVEGRKSSLRVEGIFGVRDSIAGIGGLIPNAREVDVESASKRRRQKAALRTAEAEAHLVERRCAKGGVDRQGGQALVGIVVVVDVANSTDTAGGD